MSCDALSSLDLGHFVPTVHSPSLAPHPYPCPLLAPQSQVLALNGWKGPDWGGVPAIVHSEILWALKADFLLKFLYSLKLFY